MFIYKFKNSYGNQIIMFDFIYTLNFYIFLILIYLNINVMKCIIYYYKPKFKPNIILVLIDGTCNLCLSYRSFILSTLTEESSENIIFINQQSSHGKSMFDIFPSLKKYKLNTIITIEISETKKKYKIYTHSSAGKTHSYNLFLL